MGTSLLAGTAKAIAAGLRFARFGAVAIYGHELLGLAELHPFRAAYHGLLLTGVAEAATHVG